MNEKLLLLTIGITLMKIKYSMVLFLIISANLWGEEPYGYDPFRHYDKAMNVLLVWGITSTCTGISMIFHDNEMIRGVSLQNILWGTVNTGLGIFAYYKNREEKNDMSLDKKRHNFRRSMFINGFIDMIYIGSGVVMMSLGKTKKIQAAGIGFTIHGTVLLGFDWVNFGITFQ